MDDGYVNADIIVAGIMDESLIIKIDVMDTTSHLYSNTQGLIGRKLIILLQIFI